MIMKWSVGETNLKNNSLAITDMISCKRFVNNSIFYCLKSSCVDFYKLKLKTKLMFLLESFCSVFRTCPKPSIKIHISYCELDNTEWETFCIDLCGSPWRKPAYPGGNDNSVTNVRTISLRTQGGTIILLLDVIFNKLV